MSISFVDEKEAIAAVALVMIGADGIGTLGERTTLFNRLRGMEAFSSLDEAAVGALVGSMTDRLWTNLEATDTGALASDSMNSVFSAAASILDADQRQQTYLFAATLADADVQGPAETRSLQDLRAAFGL